MMESFVLKLFMGTLVCILIGVILDIRLESENHKNKSKDFRYAPLFQGNIIPIFLVANFIVVFAMSGISLAMENLLILGFNLACSLSLYYMLLMPLLPLMRRKIYARTCALFWIVPNIIYTVFNIQARPSNLLLVLHLPENLTWFLFFTWLIGFFTILGWKVRTHFHFYQVIQENSDPVVDSEILSVFQQEKENLNVPTQSKLQLITSGAIQTPLSIGLIFKNTYVVLPEKEYSKEELELIFQHEIIHILRGDAGTKFFIEFCKALCWFNPLIRIAMKKSADDLELSCDETVLIQSDASLRAQYAELILSTAGNECGFTTCLSTSASSLRYRLKNIMNPQKKHVGSIYISLAVMLIFMSLGHVALAFKGTSGKEAFYQSESSELFSLQKIFEEKDSFYTIYHCINEEKLHQLLLELPMEKVINECDLSEEERQITLSFEGPDGFMAFNPLLLQVNLRKSRE